MKVTELKRELKARGLTTSGNKNELIERLQLATMPNEENLLDDDQDLLAETVPAAAEPVAAAVVAAAPKTPPAAKKVAPVVQP